MGKLVRNQPSFVVSSRSCCKHRTLNIVHKACSRSNQKRRTKWIVENLTFQVLCGGMSSVWQGVSLVKTLFNNFVWCAAKCWIKTTKMVNDGKIGDWRVEKVREKKPHLLNSSFLHSFFCDIVQRKKKCNNNNNALQPVNRKKKNHLKWMAKLGKSFLFCLCYGKEEEPHWTNRQWISVIVTAFGLWMILRNHI